MKKFIKSITIFLVFSSAFYLLLVILVGSFLPNPFTKNLKYRIGSPGYMFTRLQEVSHINNVDILFLGSSHTYRSFDTRFFKKAGYKTFNLGSSAQTPIQTAFLLTKYLDLLNPKVVIFEVNPIVFSLDGIESSLDVVSNDDNDFKTVKFALKQKHLKVFNTLLYTLYREIVYKEKSTYKENNIKYNDSYIEGGFVLKKLLYYKPKKLDKYSWSFNEKQVESFNTIIELLKERGVKLILVQAPVTKSLYNSYSSTQDFDKEMQKKGTYYNFNKIIQLNDSLHFYDSDHLNQLGVEIFDTKMLHIINQKK